MFDAKDGLGRVQNLPLVTERPRCTSTPELDLDMSYEEMVALVINFKNLDREQQEQLVAYFKVIEKEDPAIVKRVKEATSLFK